MVGLIAEEKAEIKRDFDIQKIGRGSSLQRELKGKECHAVKQIIEISKWT